MKLLSQRERFKKIRSQSHLNVVDRVRTFLRQDLSRRSARNYLPKLLANYGRRLQ